MDTKETAGNRNIRSHYKIVNGTLAPKKGFETENEALCNAFYINSKEHTIHKMVAYKCSKCSKWHIGHNETVLTDEDHRHYKELLRNNTKFNKSVNNFFRKKI